MQLVPGAFDDATSIRTLVDALCTDDDLNVVEDATWVLVKHGGAAVTALLDAIEHNDVRARHNIVHALGKIGDAQAVRALIAATSDGHAQVRMKAVFALGQIGDAKALDALVARLGDPALEVANTAREVVQGFGEVALMPLIGALTMESAHARELAASLLGDIGDARAVDALTAALATDNWPVRVAILEALGSIGDRRALPTVQALIDDPQQPVRAMAKAMVTRFK